MIEHELLLLGLLRQGPKHGYDIKAQVREILSLFAGIQLKSVYYPLRILEQKGLVGKRIARIGKRPKRIIYSLTNKGKKRFEDLLGRSLLELKRPQFSLDLSLYFLHYLNPVSARNRLRARLRILKRISLGMEKMVNVKPKNNPSPLSRILEHNIQMLKAESCFLSGIIKKY